jgi:hypothetical protein
MGQHLALSRPVVRESGLHPRRDSSSETGTSNHAYELSDCERTAIRPLLVAAAESAGLDAGAARDVLTSGRYADDGATLRRNGGEQG